MISRLELQNFKCFHHMEMECKPFTVLCGVNSCGKSSVIQAMLLAREAWESNGNFDLMNMKYNADLYSFDEILYDNAEEEEISVKLTINEHDIGFVFYSEENDNNVYYQSNPLNAYPVKNWGKVWYLGSDRTISQLQKRGNVTKLELGKESEYIGFILEKGRSNKIPVDKRRNCKDMENLLLMTQVNEWLDYILPGNQVMAATTGNDNLISMRFGKEQKLHKTNVGYGISFILPILVSGLLAGKGDIVIVENPELHLHPKAQSALMRFLARLVSTGVQVIIETHSDHIVNGLRKVIVDCECGLESSQAAIYFFDSACQAKRITIDENADLSEWPEDFMEQEEMDLYFIRKMRMMNDNRHTNEYPDNL
ncbi:MAG: AAA family ATPase [Lachnospiraceae bacterium]|nr:AAA family ATPase [Lachnospiraceae bacterium]